MIVAGSKFVIPGRPEGPNPEPMNTGLRNIFPSQCSWVPGSRAGRAPRNDAFWLRAVRMALVGVWCVALWVGSGRADEGDGGRGSMIANQGKVVASGPVNAVQPCRHCHGERRIGDGSG